jgi:ABC-type antimicrobial peptide transport system permease subunit
MARVRAIGASRQETLASHLAQHAAVTVLATALGTGCGILLAVLLAPLLVVSPVGEPADPAVTLSWAPGPTAVVVTLILGGGLLVAVPASLAMVGRSTVAALRAGEAP